MVHSEPNQLVAPPSPAPMAVGSCVPTEPPSLSPLDLSLQHPSGTDLNAHSLWTTTAERARHAPAHTAPHLHSHPDVITTGSSSAWHQASSVSQPRPPFPTWSFTPSHASPTRTCTPDLHQIPPTLGSRPSWGALPW